MSTGPGDGTSGGCTVRRGRPAFRAAIVDRLTFNGAFIETGTNSYRLAQTRVAVVASVRHRAH
ncbi:hypothetical protein ACFWBC_05240 [Streptomyces sp. NPDC059985]|uniref:hypothetical protein n=1 Tax=Streptomyces sp. NPDC059985 TaxID=3347025 RepID=UPI0036A7DEC1